MPRLRKDCSLCGKQGLLKLSNHLADCYHLSTKLRQTILFKASENPPFGSHFKGTYEITSKR